MKKTLIIIVLAVLVVVGTLGGWMFGRYTAFRQTMPDTSPDCEKLRWIEHADVVADFRQHVEREHDTRFLTRFGLSFTSEFFGLTETREIQQLVQKHGSRRLEAGDDIITSAEQMQLQQQIGTYGIRYNSMLLGYLECQK